MNSRQRIQFDEAALTAIWLGLAMWIARVCAANQYSVTRAIEACRWSGYMTLGFLALSLLVGPLLRLLTWLRVQVKPEISARISRNAGIASGLAAILHAVVALALYLDYDWQAAWQWGYLRSGVLALFVFLMLLFGSIKPLMTRARWQLWKPLFRLSFVAAVLALDHLFYAPFASRTWTLGLFSAAAILSLARWVPLRSAANSQSEVAQERTSCVP